MTLQNLMQSLLVLVLSMHGFARAADSDAFQKTCVRDQLEAHRSHTAGELSADLFTGFCNCVSSQLEQQLTPDQRKTLTQALEKKPTWLRMAEKKAHSACMQSSARIST